MCGIGLWLEAEVKSCELSGNMEERYSSFGDSITWIFDPVGGCADPDYEWPYNAPYLSEIYAYWFSSGNFGDQITQRISPQRAPLSSTVEVSIIRTDPERGEAMPPVIRYLESEEPRRQVRTDPNSKLPDFEIWRE